MTQEISLPKPKMDQVAALERNIKVLQAFLPSHINANQMWANIITEANKLPQNVSGDSLKIAAVNLCVLGLIPGPARGHAYLVPFRQKNAPPGAQLIVGYKGFLELAYANRYLRDCNPEVHLQGEELRRWHDADGPQILHEIPPDRPPVTRDNLQGCYCTFHTTGGGRGHVYVPRHDIDKIDRGAGSNTPWRDDYGAMVLKTAIRRAAKLWRITPELSGAILVDEEADREAPQTSLARLPEDDTPEDDYLANLKATLSGKLGAETEADQVMVCEWVVGCSMSSMGAITQEEAKGILEQLMAWSDEMAPETMLQRAIERRETIG